jgi:hypothetical protein
MAIRVQLLGCIDCYVSGNSDRVVLINSSGMKTPPASGRTYIQNGRYIPSNFTSVNASATVRVTGDYSVYKSDCSIADVNFEVDTVAMSGCSFTIKCVAAGNDFVFSTKSGTGLFEQAATPFTLTPVLLDSYTIWSDGTDLFII